MEVKADFTKLCEKLHIMRSRVPYNTCILKIYRVSQKNYKKKYIVRIWMFCHNCHNYCINTRQKRPWLMICLIRVELASWINVHIMLDHGWQFINPYSCLIHQTWSRLAHQAWSSMIYQSWYQAWTRVDELSAMIKHDINIDLAGQLNHDQAWYHVWSRFLRV